MKNATEHYQEILKHCMEEEDKEAGRGLGLTPIGLSYSNGLLTGFFVNPADLTYLHVWEVRIDGKHICNIYSDTWREVMLFPIDGYRFPRYVILLKEKEELEHMGFLIPESPKNGTLELDDVQWRALWQIKENLANFERDANERVDWRDPKTGVIFAYKNALQDLRDILGDW